MVDLALRHRRVGEAAEARVLEVLRSGRYIGGPVVEELEVALARTTGRAFCVGAHSGTHALTMALMAAGIGPGDEVLVPAVTFFATVESVLHTGATPVVVDVLADRPLMDPSAARATIGPRTKAVVPVHLFGSAAPDLRDTGLLVIDDAAQAIGAGSASFSGQASALSFYPTKVLGAAGDGGAVLTDDTELAQRVRLLGQHGAQVHHEHRLVAGHVGGNSRLGAVQAAVLLAHLEDLPARLERRRQIALRYSAEFGKLVVPWDQDGPVSVFAIRHPARDRLAEQLRLRGIETAIYYPAPVSAQPVIPPSSMPAAEAFCREALALPCHEGMDEAQVDVVLEALQELA